MAFCFVTFLLKAMPTYNLVSIITTYPFPITYYYYSGKLLFAIYGPYTD